MQEVILLKAGEIVLKGLNRSIFEDLLIRNAKRRLAEVGPFTIRKAQSTIYVEPQREGLDLEEAMDRLSKVFGVSALTRAAVVEKDYEKIEAAALSYLEEELLDAGTFKVAAKRSDKRFPMNSPEICAKLGGAILAAFPHLKVDVLHPELTVTVEVRDFAAYIHPDQKRGAGGLPVGSGGRAMLLISGGIDSPVAGYMMARRGLEIQAVHYASPPYTSEFAKQKVIKLAQKLCAYCGRITLHIIPFTQIQEQIKDNCPEDLFTLVMRRMMMRVALELAAGEGAGALITGESVGQVASQTLPAIACTDAVCTIPVLRPVIGMDKEDIIAVARKIDTFETSVLPYEDCCTVFTPKHPRTRPRLSQVEQAEKALDIPALVQRAVEGREILQVQG